MYSPSHLPSCPQVAFPGIELYADYFLIMSTVSFTTFKSIAFASERVWFASCHGDQSSCLSAGEGRSKLYTPETQPPRSASISPLTSTDSTAAASSHCSSNPGVRKWENLNRSTCRSDTDGAPEMLRRSTQGGSHSPSVGGTDGGSHSPLRCPDLVDGLLYTFYMPFASPGLLVPLQVFLARVSSGSE